MLSYSRGWLLLTFDVCNPLLQVSVPVEASVTDTGILYYRRAAAAPRIHYNISRYKSWQQDGKV